MYTERMVRSGFDDVETLLAMEDSDIKALGFTTQHAAVLRRKMQEHRGACGGRSAGARLGFGATWAHLGASIGSCWLDFNQLRARFANYGAISASRQQSCTSQFAAHVHRNANATCSGARTLPDSAS